MMKELKRCEIMRRIEQNDADGQQYEPSLRDEAATQCPSVKKKGDLKKQTQFAPALMGVTSFVKGDYINKPACGAEENKANQSQSNAPALIKGVGKREKSVAAATG